MSTAMLAKFISAHRDEGLMHNVDDYPPQFEIKVSEIKDYIILHMSILASTTATNKFIEYFSGHKSLHGTTPTPDKSVKLFSGTATARYYIHFEDETQAEAKTIREWYVEKVSQILEAEAILCEQDEERIRFAVVVDGHIRRNHSFQLSDIACELYDLYPHRKFGFQYITTHTAAQLPLDEYLDITNGS
jgi:hypothetical protein